MLLKDVLFESSEIEKKLSAIDSRIRLSEMEIKIANDKIKKITANISRFQNEITEQKIKHLKKKGWSQFVFTAKDTQDQRLYSFLEVTFLLKKGVFKKEFKKIDFECHFGKGFAISFSSASASYKNEAFYEFERWLRSQNTDDYIVVKDIWF